MPKLSTRSTTLLFALLALAACGRTRPVAEDEYQDYRTRGPEVGKLGGGDGLIFGIGKGSGGKDGGSDQGGAGLGVNGYLWRGTLDTLAFMPLASADPFGGVIITDWYQPPAGSGERFKATAYILSRQLRADGVRVSVFRQVIQNGQWVDSPVNSTTTADIENKILARARELRSQSAG